MMELVSDVLLIAGAALAVLTGLALLEFDDVLARLHGATKIGSLGLIVIIAGAALRLPDAGSTTKLLLAGCFQLLTAPVLSHLVARAGVRTGDTDPSTRYIDLAGERSPGSDGDERP